jgi:hypothetical protein
VNAETLKVDWDYIASRFGEGEVEESEEMTERELRGCHL